MSLLASAHARLRVAHRPRAADRDVADEVQHYFDEAAAGRIASRTVAGGGSARRPARVRQPDERPRAGARIRMGERVGTLLADLRYAAAVFAAHRPSQRSACSTLALGIGATHGDLQRGEPDSVRAAALPVTPGR